MGVRQLPGNIEQHPVHCQNEAGVVVAASVTVLRVAERPPVASNGGMIVGADRKLKPGDGRVGEDLQWFQRGDGSPPRTVLPEEPVALAVRGPDPASPGLDGIFDCLLVDAFVERDIATFALHDDQDVAIVEQLDVGPNSGADRVAHPWVAPLQPQVFLGPSIVVDEPVEDTLANPLLGSGTNRLVADQALNGSFGSVGDHRIEVW